MVLHSHISGAPFQGGQQHSYGLHVDVYQQPGCVVDQLRLKFDVLASIAKITLRLRVAAIVWAIGWSAAILYRQLSALRATGELSPSSPLTRHQRLCQTCPAFSRPTSRALCWPSQPSQF